MEVQELGVISLNIWQIVISMCNLLIMFLILKRFLFKPVQKVLAQRHDEVEKVYSEADESRRAADTMKQEYETHMASAREEADSIVRSATDTARRKGDAIVAQAEADAAHIKQKADEEIVRERSQMLQDVRGEISDLVVSAASKVIGREISESDEDRFVDDFIQNVGDRK